MRAVVSSVRRQYSDNVTLVKGQAVFGVDLLKLADGFLSLNSPLIQLQGEGFPCHVQALKQQLEVTFATRFVHWGKDALSSTGEGKDPRSPLPQKNSAWLLVLVLPRYSDRRGPAKECLLSGTGAMRWGARGAGEEEGPNPGRLSSSSGSALLRPDSASCVLLRHHR